MQAEESTKAQGHKHRKKLWSKGNCHWQFYFILAFLFGALSVPT